MSNEESRLKGEFGGMLVNLRKPGEAVIVGGEIAVMVVKVVGQQVRIGVASKTKMSVWREETYREKRQERERFGKPTFQQFYRGDDAEGPVYSLTNDDEDYELVSSPDGVKEGDKRISIMRFDNQMEVLAIKTAVELLGPECKADIAELAKKWLIMVVKPGVGHGYTFADFTTM